MTLFRNVNAGVREYQLEKDLFKGLKNAIDTNRQILALEYIQKILREMHFGPEAPEQTPEETELESLRKRVAELEELDKLLAEANKSETVTRTRKKAPAQDEDAS